jgi:NitT/TauT family transport system substrate-binding protein
MEANAFIAQNPGQTAEIYLKMTGEKIATLAQMTQWVADPDVSYTIVPMKVMEFANFMQKVGRVKRVAPSWKDMFFPETQGVAGS